MSGAARLRAALVVPHFTMSRSYGVGEELFLIYASAIRGIAPADFHDLRRTGRQASDL
jgi:hypothetical protein